MMPLSRYDMDFSGPLYPLCAFVRDVYQRASEQD